MSGTGVVSPPAAFVMVKAAESLIGFTDTEPAERIPMIGVSVEVPLTLFRPSTDPTGRRLPFFHVTYPSIGSQPS